MLLYEPDQDEDDFVLTPDFDAVLAEWTAEHPEQPHGPAFTVAEVAQFTFRWPATRPVKKKGPR